MSLVGSGSGSGCGEREPKDFRRRRALPQIALDNAGPVTMARSAGGSPLRFEPISLPPVPQNLADWCVLAGQRFWIDRGRCLGIVLLLDVRRLTWSAAIPSQRCGRGAGCWSAALADFPTFPPDTALAGSFQTRVLAGGEEPDQCPPPHGRTSARPETGFAPTGRRADDT